MPRPSWDDYFMAIAEQVSGRSTCMRRHCGAVLVKDKRILATGYNGAASGLSHCEVVGCLREQRGIPSGTQHELCRGIHAEQNAVIQAAKHGIPIEGSTVYCTHQPCVLCAKILLNAGVVDIVFRDPYPDALSEELLAEAGVVPRQFAASSTDSPGSSPAEESSP
jgi:dCMP deaminase